MNIRLLSLLVLISVIFLPLNVLAETENIGVTTDERLSRAVQDNSTTLDDVSKANIALKCLNAQTLLKNIQNESDVAIRQRIITYSNIQKDLQAVKLRMIKQGADASETDLLTGKIQQLLDQFTLQANKYGVSLDDVVGVDCNKKPEQFIAGLIVMRINRAGLLDSANNLKLIIQNSNNEIFNQLKRRLSI